jgi:hypothetical protein
MYAFFNDLCESHLIPSQTSLKKWETAKIAELAYLYLLGLRVLLSHDKTQKWAKDYCAKAGEPNDFLTWRSSSNDLYVLLHALSVDPDDDPKVTHDIHITPGVIRSWLRHADGGKTLFTRLDGMFHITTSALKSMRRIVAEWDDADHDEQQATLTKLIQMIHDRAPSSELLPHLKKLVKIDESASMGATGAANVATAVGGLGAGFSDEHWRSIFPSKKKMTKPSKIKEGDVIPFGRPEPNKDSSRAVARHIQQLLSKRFSVGAVKAAAAHYVERGEGDKTARFDIPEDQYDAIKAMLCAIYGPGENVGWSPGMHGWWYHDQSIVLSQSDISVFYTKR